MVATKWIMCLRSALLTQSSKVTSLFFSLFRVKRDELSTKAVHQVGYLRFIAVITGSIK